jgi:hypothetical protein
LRFRSNGTNGGSGEREGAVASFPRISGIVQFLALILVGAVFAVLVFKYSFVTAVGVLAGLILLCAIFIRPEYGLYLAALAIPLGNFSPLSSFEGTLTASRLFAFLAMGVVLVRSVMGYRAGALKRTEKNLLLLVLSCIILLSALTGMSPGDSIIGLFYYYASFIIYVMVVLLIRDETSLRRVVFSILLSITVFLVWGVLSFHLDLSFAARFSVSETRRMTSTAYLGPNSFGLLLVTVFPFAFNYYLHEKATLKRYLYLAWAGLIVYGTLITFSRASTVTIALLTLYILVRSFRKVRRREILGFCAAGLLVLLLLPSLVFDRVESLSRGEDDPSLRSRWAYILVGYEIVKDNPILGVGPNNYKLAYASPQYRSIGYVSESNAEIAQERGRVGRAAHNLYVETVCEIGVPGILLLLWVFFLTWQEYRLAQGKISGGESGERFLLSINSLEIGFLAFLLNSFFLSTEFFPILWFLLGLSSASRDIAARRAGEALTV